MGTLRDWGRLDRHIDDAVRAVRSPATKATEAPSPIDIPDNIKSLSNSDLGQELANLKARYLRNNGARKLIRNHGSASNKANLLRLEQLTAEWSIRLKSELNQI